MTRTRTLVPALILAALFVASPVMGSCEGDSNGDGRVTVDELIRVIHIAPGTRLIDDCANFEDGYGHLDVLPWKPLVNALQGCHNR